MNITNRIYRTKTSNRQHAPVYHHNAEVMADSSLRTSGWAGWYIIEDRDSKGMWRQSPKAPAFRKLREAKQWMLTQK